MQTLASERCEQQAGQRTATSLTVTGKSLAQNLRPFKRYPRGQQIIRRS